MVEFRPLDRCLDELARDTLAAQRFRDARVNQDQTVTPASIDKLGFAAVLRPDQTVVSRVAHYPSVRGHGARHVQLCEGAGSDPATSKKMSSLKPRVVYGRCLTGNTSST